jgi:four helix bundle protein
MEREPAKSFKDLIVWQKAHELVLSIYPLTKNFPKEETYGLTSQVRRSSAFVAANIAEVFKKRGPKDKLRILNSFQYEKV